MTHPAPCLSIVVPCLNESESFPHTVATLRRELDRMIEAGLVTASSYLFFVDDGSTDDTWAQVERAHRADPQVKGLRLSRNFGHQNALMAGLMAVRERCDASVSIDADLQQDPAAIARFVERYRDGADIVLGVRTDRRSDGFFKRRSAGLFYSLMTFMGVRLVRNHADYRLLGRRAMQALAGYGESQIFLRAMCTDLGFRQEIVTFDVRDRPFGETKYSLRRMLRLAIHGITSFSVVPLRMVSIVGVVVFVLSVLMACYVLFRSLVIGDTVPGWASTALPIYLIGGIQILCLGVVGEYVGQIYSNGKGRPRYIHDTELF